MVFYKNRDATWLGFHLLNTYKYLFDSLLEMYMLILTGAVTYTIYIKTFFSWT